MSNFKVVVPETTENLFLNPSAEIAGNFTQLAGTVVTRESTYGLYGAWAYEVVSNADNEGISLTTKTLTNAIHYVTLRIRGTLPASWDVSMDNITYTDMVDLGTVDGNWTLYGLQLPAAQCNGRSEFYIRQDGAGVGDFYIDGLQLELKEYYTTYIDGDLDGGEWTGVPHGSSSRRSVLSSIGGRLRDLQDDFYFRIDRHSGLGAAPRTVVMDEYCLLPGGEINMIVEHARLITLGGEIHDTTEALLQSKLDALIDLFANWELIRFRYTGKTVPEELTVCYAGGLEGNMQQSGATWIQRFELRMIAPSPFFAPVGDSSKATMLDVVDTATFRYAAARLKNNGQWGNMNFANPPAGGAGWFVIEHNPKDNKIYMGGSQTSINGQAGRDYVCRYNVDTDTVETVGTLGVPTGAIGQQAMAIDAEGNVYVGGGFANWKDGNGDRIVRFNLGTQLWESLAAGGLGMVNCIAVGLDGMVYIGGDFINWGGLGANADYIIRWNGAAFSVMPGGDVDDIVREIVVLPNGDLVITGDFLNAGGAGANRVVRYNVAADTYSTLGAGLDDVGRKIAVYADGRIVVGGDFANVDGNAMPWIAEYNWTSWKPLGGIGSMTVAPWAMAMGPDGMLWVTGAFAFGGASDRLGRWNGASWAHWDYVPPGAPLMYALACGAADPSNNKIYDVFVGHTTTGAGYHSGKVTITNAGKYVSYPKFVISRSGGTQADLYTLRNETTGLELLFHYELLDGEILTIDMDPAKKTIVSSMFGSRPDAMLANSDFGAWALVPGANDITCFVDIVAATVEAYIQWKDPT